MKGKRDGKKASVFSEGLYHYMVELTDKYAQKYADVKTRDAVHIYIGVNMEKSSKNNSSNNNNNNSKSNSNSVMYRPEIHKNTEEIRNHFRFTAMYRVC